MRTASCMNEDAMIDQDQPVSIELGRNSAGAPSLMSLVADALMNDATVIHLSVPTEGSPSLRWRQYGKMVEAPALETSDALSILGELHGDPDWRASQNPDQVFETLRLGHDAANFPVLIDLLEVEITPIHPGGVYCVIKMRGNGSF